MKNKGNFNIFYVKNKLINVWNSDGNEEIISNTKRHFMLCLVRGCLVTIPWYTDMKAGKILNSKNTNFIKHYVIIHTINKINYNFKLTTFIFKSDYLIVPLIPEYI